MYRYVNSEGHKVVAYQVPPEFVANGYEILSAKGSLIAVVPRQLDDSERSDMNAQERLEREAEEERERLRKWDESLLLRYSTVADIEAARERALRELRIRVSILKGKLRSLKQQVENYQAMAADQERLGNSVDVEHLKAIDDLQSEIESTERAVSDRQEEIAAVDASYDRDIDRFSTLLDVVKMRKAVASGDHTDS
jgi:chromosome segregation ATPase